MCIRSSYANKAELTRSKIRGCRAAGAWVDQEAERATCRIDKTRIPASPIMSHYVECQTEFRDAQALVAALIECGFAAEQIEVIVAGYR
jgi:hypothetical protein